MNRAKFYDALRHQALIGARLDQRQVDGTEALLDVMEGWSIPFTAHVLGECAHETQGGMYPVKETVFRYSRNKNPTDAMVIARLNRAWARGRLPWVSEPYWRDGAFGRGQIQLTHWFNYEKGGDLIGVNLVDHPEKALELENSAKIAALGCEAGLFTGKSLADYDKTDGFDHYHARAIVNGDTRANGRKVRDLCLGFERALREAA